MNEFTILPCRYLEQPIQGYYHQDYTTFRTPGNPDFINHLKNTFNRTDSYTLNNSVDALSKVLKEDLLIIKNKHKYTSLTVCVIPRAKAEHLYSDNQRLFKTTVSNQVKAIDGLIDGTTFITRHTNTKTTHLAASTIGGGDGDMPYVGITKDTCSISSKVQGKDILLIDDIYTRGVDIDEDAIQALLDKGARSVLFYAVGKTNKG